jgi:hypothetical protein
MFHERQIRELEGFSGRGAAVLTVYLNAGPAARRATLQESVERLVQPLAARLDQAGRTDLREEVAVIRDYLGSLMCAPEALALFSCGRRRFFRVVRLPVEVTPAASWAEQPDTAQLREAADRLVDRLEPDAMIAVP